MRKTQLTLIAEDQQHDCFARKLLKERGCDTRMIRVLKSPHGRGTDEAIIFHIPKRNIETWIHTLRGHDANETDTYPRLTYPSACTEGARRMDEWCREQNRAMLPSMQMASEELKRMPRNK